MNTREAVFEDVSITGWFHSSKCPQTNLRKILHYCFYLYSPFYHDIARN